jgi:hypothetical protein
MLKRLTYANVMSSIAVFVALGGGAYAAATLPKNSVGAQQIKSNAVTSSKVKNGSLLSTDFQAGQLPRGDKGDPGGQGSKGDTGAPGQDGQAGPTGPAGPGAVKLNAVMTNDNAGGGAPTVQVLPATDGYTISLTCTGSAGGHFFRMGAGGTGGAQLEGVKTIDDQPGSTFPVTAGTNLSFGGNAQMMQLGASNNTLNHYYREGGTMVFHDSAVVTVVYDMFLDDSNGAGICSFRGTAVRAD